MGAFWPFVFHPNIPELENNEVSSLVRAHSHKTSEFFLSPTPLYFHPQ